MRVVITGATGFIGKWLVKELIYQKDEVIAIVRDKKNVPVSWGDKVLVIEASMKKMADLQISDFGGVVDLFFHFAWTGVSGVKHIDFKSQLDNIEGISYALELAIRLKCARFINAGSIMEYEAMQYIPRNGVKPSMVNVYSVAKLAADFMAKTLAAQEDIMYINMIISNAYGAGENSCRFLNSTLRKMMKNEDIELTKCIQLYDFIYITDAVRAIVFAGKNGRNNSAYYIGNSRQYPLKDFVLRMKRVLGSESKLLFGAIGFEGISISYDQIETNKLEEMGCKPKISFEQGIKMTQDWNLRNIDQNFD